MEKRAFQTQLPKGVKIYLPDEAAAKRSVEQRLFSVFTRWGYREVVTPTYEFADVLSVGTDETLQGEMFKLVDRDTGRMLALRADITPQIARIVATRLRDEPKPLRLAYVANVFRYEEPQVGRYREFYQAGVELVGLEKPEADAEMIAMTVEGLQALGLDRFQINVGQADFFRGVLEELKIDRERGRQLQEALSRKDASTLERLVKDLAPPASTAELLVALPDLFGREEVLERGARLVKNPRSDRALANLAEVHRLLRAYGLADAVILDLGEVRGFDYYSGVHFEGYVSGLGAPLCGGGRYDHMLGRFGYDCPATGFAFEVGRALLAMEAQGVAVPQAGPDFFIIDFTPEKTVALSLSRRLRDLGAAVARDIITRGLPESLAYARGQRARWALVIGGPKTRAEEVLAIELATGAEQKIRAADLLEAPAKWFPMGGARA
ncbi:MAG: ATP phosphoribosyltransferase regulatory subunit [Candidatus Rokubacteria bacterium CSP1-6]|nr:MAG: ATP phosphoribosyltransferase regulatory subunit [Candidatus Rokubacteria bacterium CSP1-6]